jgi:hypothetical protein
MEFLPELQREFGFVDLKVESSRVTVRMVSAEQQSYPDTLGRHVSDIRSWPTVWHESTSVEVTFENVLVLVLTEERSGEEDESAVFDGTRFRYYSESLLLRRQRETHGDHVPLLHYELVFADEQISVVCGKAPVVVVKG